MYLETGKYFNTFTPQIENCDIDLKNEVLVTIKCGKIKNNQLLKVIRMKYIRCKKNVKILPMTMNLWRKKEIMAKKMLERKEERRLLTAKYKELKLSDKDGLTKRFLRRNLRS